MKTIKVDFFTARKEPIRESLEIEKQPFAVDIDLSNFNSRGVVEAERLIGFSVLGFFDHLTNGRVKLPKNYREE